MMKKGTIKDYLANIKNWDSLYNKLKLIEKRDSVLVGRLFEQFAKLYFLQMGECKKVYLLKEAPLSLLNKYNIQQKDHGADLILIFKDDRIAVVQCKFTRDQSNNTLGWSKDRLSSFLAASTKSDVRIIFTNASGVASSVIKKARELEYRQVDFTHLDELSEDDFRSIYKLSQGKKPLKKRFLPRYHQKKAISEVIRGLKNRDRGKLILPCGAGKTLTSLWIKERLRAKKTLVLVPSLALLRQFKNDWRMQEKFHNDYICVCSDKDVLGKDEASLNSYEIGGLVLTDPLKIRKILNSSKDIVVYCTYQSSPQIAQAIKGTKLAFDLIICDEAHRTSGQRLGPLSFSSAHQGFIVEPF